MHPAAEAPSRPAPAEPSAPPMSTTTVRRPVTVPEPVVPAGEGPVQRRRSVAVVAVAVVAVVAVVAGVAWWASGGEEPAGGGSGRE